MAEPLLGSVLQIYTELGRQVAAEATAHDALQAVATVASRSVPGADAVSISRQRLDHFETVAATDDAAVRADEMQYQLGHGPCVDAVEKDHVFRVADLSVDPRWPTFGPLAASAVGVHSVLSIRLTPDEDPLMAGLNIYAYQRAAFDQEAQQLAMLLATHASAVVSKLAAEDKASQLQEALARSREIGVAMGVLMSAHRVTREQAFDMLRIASQNSHRKLRDIAIEVADTGTLDLF